MQAYTEPGLFGMQGAITWSQTSMNGLFMTIPSDNDSFCRDTYKMNVDNFMTPFNVKVTVSESAFDVSRYIVKIILNRGFPNI